MSLSDICWQNFVNNIIWLRKSNKLSKEEMAKIMHIDISLLERVEKGEGGDILEADVIYEIYEYFNIRPNDLMCKQLEKYNK